MQGDETTIPWDPSYIHRVPSTAFKIYMLFLLVAIVAAFVKLISLWMAAPPFRLSRQANNPAYLKRLQASQSSFKQWIGGTLLAGSLLASIDFYHACNRLLAAKAAGSTLILLVIRDSSTSLSLAMTVALFLFLAQWHLHNRIAHLRK